MSYSHSVSDWIAGAKNGDADAQQQLWERYYQKLVRRACARLAVRTKTVADEDDIAISVFESFYRAATEGRFPNLRDRDGLWKLLLIMTIRKTVDHHRKWGKEPDWRGTETIERIVGEEPDPQLTAAAVEEATRLLNLLKDDELRQIAVAKLEGYTNEEIATSIDKSVSSVERRLRRIRWTWDPEQRFDDCDLRSLSEDQESQKLEVS